MTKILIANSDQVEITKISASIGSAYDITSILCASQCSKDLSEFDLLVIDENFTEFQGIDFLMQVVSNNNMPVLMLSPEDDPKTAAESINSGAYNYIVKTENYIPVLEFAIRDAIRYFDELSVRQQQILSLKKQVQELESTLVGENSAKADLKKERNLFDDVVNSLKLKQVNLPDYSEVSKQFREMADRGSSIRDVSSLLVTDAGISSKLISVSNSVYYRGMTPIKTLDQAIGRIGITETASYVELISNRGLYVNSNKKYGAYLEKLWKHSLACGFACQELSKTLLFKKPMELFSMGLFHDIGKLLLIHILSDLESKGTYEEEVTENEWVNLVSTHHGQFGAALMKMWKFPAEFSHSARYNEHPETAPELTKELWVVCLADLISKSLGYTDDEHAEVVNIEQSTACKELGLSYSDAHKVKTAVAKIMEDSIFIRNDDTDRVQEADDRDLSPPAVNHSQQTLIV